MFERFFMFSKFDANIQSDELASHEPTQADWQEYQEWLESQEAAEPELEPMDFDPHRDFYAEMDSDEYEWTEEAKPIKADGADEEDGAPEESEAGVDPTEPTTSEKSDSPSD